MFRIAILTMFLAVGSTASAALRTWDGGGDGVSWHIPANWSGDLLPVDGDDVAITTGTGVLFSTGSVQLATLNSTRPLTISGGSLGVTGSFTMTNAALALTGGALSGVPSLTGSTISVGPTLPSPATIIALGATNMLTQLESALATIIVRGTTGNGTGEIDLPDAFVLGAGTIRLESTGAQTSRISGNGFVNGPQGLIEVAAPIAPRQILGDGFVNEGLITIAVGVSLTLPSLGIVELRDGAIENASGLKRTNGTLLVSGGALDSEVSVTGTTIRIADSLGSPATIVALGSANSLEEMESPVGTVIARGTTTNGTAELDMPDGFVIGAGTIRLESTGAQTSRLTGNAVMNGAAGIIEVKGAAGTRQITGNGFVNEGLIAIDPAVELTLPSAGAVELRGGEIQNGSGFRRTAGTLLITGGSHDGELTVTSTEIRIAGTLTDPALVVAVGTTNSLHEMESPLGAVVVRGTTLNSTADLGFPDDFKIGAGTIRLESSGAQISRLTGNGLVNGAQGIIEVAGPAATRQITGNGFVNEGTITIAPEVELTLPSAGIVELRDGAVIAPSAFARTTGTLRVTGSAVTGEVRCTTTTIEFSETLDEPVTVFARGSLNTLAQHASPLGTVIAQSTSANGLALLTVPVGFVNGGTIRLESANIAGTSRLNGDGTITNGPTGAIIASGVNGGTRQIADPLINAGRLEPGPLLTIAQTLECTSSSLFAIAINGSAPGQFDRLHVTGAATLDGTIEVSRSDEFIPAPGSVFVVVDAASRSGVFDVVQACDPIALVYTPTQARVVFGAISRDLGDLSGDGSVDGADLGLLLSTWGSCIGLCCPGDLNGDDTVDGADFGLLLSNWS